MPTPRRSTVFGGLNDEAADVPSRFNAEPGTATLNVPRAACRLASSVEEQPVQLAVETTKEGKSTYRFKGKANSGGIMPPHWYWGRLAIDMSGLKLGRKDKPVLRDHSPSSICGYTTSLEKGDQGLDVEGLLLPVTDAGKQVVELMGSGFPMQHSIDVLPERVQRLEENEVALVNGREFKGPGTIFRKSFLREVTLTACGHDENTGAALLSDSEAVVIETYRENNTTMGKQDEPAKKPETPAPVALSAEDAVKAERERVLKIQGMANDMEVDAKLSAQAVTEGWTVEKAAVAFCGYHRERKEARLAAVTETTPKPNGVDDASVDKTGVTKFREQGAAEAAKLAAKEAGKAKPGATKEEQWKARFAASKKLQHEFLGKEELFLSYMRNEGDALELAAAATAEDESEN